MCVKVDVLAPALEDVALYAGTTTVARYAFSRQRDSVIHAMRSVGALVTVSVYEPSTPAVTAGEGGETSGLQVFAHFSAHHGSCLLACVLLFSFSFHSFFF